MLEILTLGWLFTVEQQTVAVVERFGKFRKVCTPGLNMKVPFIDSIAGRMSLRVQQLDVEVESKTSDDVFVNVTIALQFYVQQAKVEDAFYKLTDSQRQIESFIFDVVRAQVPDMTIDSVFSEKEKIADQVKEQLDITMGQYGYEIVKALVNDINPNAEVKEAMNRVRTAEREREAAKLEADANYIRIVREAEADAESKKLSGKGLAEQRIEIVNGLKKSVQLLATAVPGVSEQDVLNHIVLVQEMDMLQAIGANDKSHTIFMPYTPGSTASGQSNLMAALLWKEWMPFSERQVSNSIFSRQKRVPVLPQ